jgi:hypothetical protein
MGVVMERWCPTQQMLGVFSEETEVKKLLLAGTTVLLMATSASAQSVMTYGMYTGGCSASSFGICRYRANLRRNGEYAYRRSHNGNPSPAYQKSLAQQRATRPCTPATVWKDACG